ncbi:SIR2 family protein [Vibrio splendidus]
MEFEIPQELSDAVKNQKLVIFVGAGLSVNCGLPNWKDIVIKLLEENDNYIEKAANYLDAISSGILEPLEVLDKIKIEKKRIFEHFEHKLSENTQSDLHKKLGLISSRFVTTNFDKLIEENTKVNVITNSSDYNLSKIDTENKFVLKIHGDINQVDSCVIFSDQYDKLYTNEVFSTFQLKKMFSTYNVLFVGFSFSDPYVTKLFDNITELQNSFGPKHFFISDSKSVIRNLDDKKIPNLDCIDIGNYNNLTVLIDNLVEVNKPNTSNSGTVEIQEPIISKYIDGSDIAPEVTGWVGRVEELETLKSDYFKVVFITGIGGGGKSALASQYLKHEDGYDVAEWKDFKEQDHKFQHKIISMILNVSTKFSVNDLIGFSDSELIQVFFKELGEKRAVFVLDNVDSYIDLENFEPTNGVGELFVMAMTSEHNSKFIFTCRPFVQYAKPRFIQLNLTGLTEDDTIEYFIKAGSSIKKEKIIDYAKESFALTNGHALWLSLILAHSKKGEAALIKFLDSIGNGSKINQNDTSILSKNVLSSVWHSLHDRDKLVLRTLAESVVAETKEDYSEILRDELNYKNYQRALKSLYSFNLIVEKRNSDYIELHPLVKEFVTTNYPPSERTKYISYLVKFYDKWAVILKEKLSVNLSFQEFTNFTKKAELSINAQDYQSAVSSLLDVHESMCSAGYIEEYLRVSDLLFKSITWSKKIISSITGIEALIKCTAKSSVEFGDTELTKHIISSYSSIIEQKESNHIQLCEIKAYDFWFNKDYESAINVCEEANYLLKRAGQEENYQINHTLSLSHRDSEIKENVDKALDFLLKNKTLSELKDINSFSDDDESTQLGNIGKCLSINRDYDNSLNCYFKSFYLIFKKDPYKRLLNLGYASSWISEVLDTQNEKDSAFYFLAYSLNCWTNSSPVLANRDREQKKDIMRNKNYINISSQEEWRIEKYCVEYIEKKLNRKLTN